MGPFPEQGVIGIAAGTVVARSLGGVVMLVVLSRGRTALKLRLPQMAFDRGIARRIVNIGGPAGLDGALMWTGHFIFLGFLMGVDADAEIGLAASAAHMIGVRIESFSFLPATAWGIAAATLVGQALGAGNPQKARRIGHIAVLQLAPYALIVTGLYYFGAEFIYSFATGDRMVADEMLFRIFGVVMAAGIEITLLGKRDRRPRNLCLFSLDLRDLGDILKAQH